MKNGWKSQGNPGHRVMDQMYQSSSQNSILNWISKLLLKIGPK